LKCVFERGQSLANQSIGLIRMMRGLKAAADLVQGVGQ